MRRPTFSGKKGYCVFRTCQYCQKTRNCPTIGPPLCPISSPNGPGGLEGSCNAYLNTCEYSPLLATCPSTTNQTTTPQLICTQQNKQKAQYLQPQFSPSLHTKPVIKLATSTKAVNLQSLRSYGKNGIYAATQLTFRQNANEKAPSGYFGMQWKGAAKQKDMFLYSIWDGDVVNYQKPEVGPSFANAIPMHANCKRNCNDCGLHGNHKRSTGVKCFVKMPENLVEDDEFEFVISRESVQSVIYSIDQATPKKYTGHVWEVRVKYAGTNPLFVLNPIFSESNTMVIGRILFEDNTLSIGTNLSKNVGIIEVSFFHEHIGCTPCGAFASEVMRTGPFPLVSALGTGVPKLVAGFANANMGCPGGCTCETWDIRSKGFGTVVFLSGDANAGTSPHWNHSNGKIRSKIFDKSGCLVCSDSVTPLGSSTSTTPCRDPKDCGKGGRCHPKLGCQWKGKCKKSNFDCKRHRNCDNKSWCKRKMGVCVCKKPNQCIYASKCKLNKDCGKRGLCNGRFGCICNRRISKKRLA